MKEETRMRYKEFLKKAKRFLAFALALTLFLGGWSNYDFSVRATETENAGNGPEDTEPVGDVEDDGSEGTPTGDENPTDEETPDTESGDNEPSLQDVSDILHVSLSSMTSSYTGSDCTPSVQVTANDSSTSLSEGTDYSIVWKDSTGTETSELINAGEYVCEIQGVNLYEGATVEFADGSGGKFTINPADITSATVELSWYEKDYTGVLQKPEVTAVKLGNRTLEQSDYTVEFDEPNSMEPKTYTLTVKGAGSNYIGQVDPKPSYTISYATIDDSVIGIKGAVHSGDTYYFKDSVQISTNGEFTLEETNSGTIKNNQIELTESVSDLTVDIKDTSTGTIGQKKLGNFVKDETAPVLNCSVTYLNEYEATDGLLWADRIDSISFSATDDQSGLEGIYYTDNNSLDKDSIEQMSKYEPDTDTVGLESGKTYYVYAKDLVGNVSDPQTVNVRNLDTDAPVITVQDGERTIAVDEILYLKADGLNNGSKEYTVTADDNEGTGVDPGSWAMNSSFTPTSVQTSQETLITNEVSDYVQNKAEHKFTVRYDVDVPELNVSVKTAEGETTSPVLTKDDVTITAKAKDNYELEKVELHYTAGDGTPEAVQELESTETDETGFNTYTFTVTTDIYVKRTYWVEAYDKAGNLAKSDEYVIEIDKEAPKLEEVTLSPSVESGNWTNQDTTFTIIVTNDNESSAVPSKILYKKGDSGTWVAVGDGKLKDGKPGETPQWEFTFKETDNIFDGTYFFRAEDSLGNITDESFAYKQEFKKDSVAPVTDPIMVLYTADNSEKADESESKGFLEWLTTFFAKEKIEVTLYIQDEGSGVASVSYKYKDTEDTSTQVDGNSMAEINDTYYYIVTITLDDDTEILDPLELKLTSIKDAAGNDALISQTQELKPITSKNVLIIDSTDPTVEVTTKKEAASTWTLNANTEIEETRMFYADKEGDAETVRLTFTEVYLEFQKNDNGESVLPEIKVLCDGQAVENPQISWGEFKESKITAEVKLEYGNNEEIEYQIEASYEDGSGNRLTDSGENKIGKTEDGIYKSDIFVLDRKNPQFLSYEITTTPAQDASGNAYEFDGANVYKNDLQKEDVTLTFSIDDNAEYWNKEELTFEIYDTSDLQNPVISIDGNNQDLSWNEPLEGRIHKATYSFDGQVNVEANYQVQITYSDRAGNKMVDGRTDSTGEELPGEINTTTGTYTSPEFILDHKAPEINVIYNNAYRVIDGEGVDVGLGIHPKTGQTAYYGSKDSNGNSEGKIEVTVQITDKYLKTKKVDEQSEDITLEDINVIAEKTETGKSGSSTTIINVTDLKWEKDGTTYTSRFTIDSSNTSKWGDGDYKVKVLFQESDRTERAYTDAAGNEMSESDTIQGGRVDGGKYTSTTLILDTEAPKLERSYTAAPVNSYNGRDYYNSQTNLVITVGDQNIRYKELKNALLDMKAFDINGTDLKESTAAWSEIQALDENRTSRGSWTATIPLTTEANYRIPISYVDLAGNAAVLNTVDQVTVDTTTPADLEFDYSINDPVNYGLFGWLFAQTKMTVRATAKDGTAGLQYIRFTVVDENKKETVRTGEFEPRADGSYSVEIPLESADFKGTVKAEVYDYSNNQIEQTRNHVVESGGKHSSTGSAVITTRTSPSRTVDGEDFYNTDVTFNLTLKDDYSGLRSYTYTGGSTLSGSRNYAEEAGTVLGEGGPEVTYEFSQDMTLAAAQNNENEVKVSAEFVDNAGHTGQVEQLYNIDVTDPEITVEWDLNDPANELYYNQTRTATVTIRERNFDADDVEFTVTNTDGAMPTFGGWSSSGSGDNTEHVCQVTFDQDGDYTFTLSFQDKAGNEASYDRVDEFTIDKTFPELTVTWNNNNSQNEFYYAESRTATIDILEHNFDPNLIDVVTTADGASAPNVSGWSRNGDHNVATVTFSADADYTFDIEGMDLAENALDEYEQEQFTVDQTAPELEIFDIENMSANNGIVMPGVRYSDTNYDPDATVIAMTGYHNGPVEMNGTRTAAANGMEIKLNDFEHVPEMDDMYTMEATVYDLAGNSSEASVIFSVNRFGSVYTFSDATDALVGDNGKYYTNEEQEIVVTETNVDTLEFREITKNLNGSLNTMAEGEEYTVSESGTDVSWKQYTYTIPKENFEEEGTYILTIYSEDRAANTSDNNTKGKQIEFVVDKTSPSILVSGVENDGQYRENSRPVTLDVQDNIRLAEVQVQIDGEETVYTAEEIVEADGKLTLTAGSANHWQEMSVTARDAAGNEETAETIRFLITSNIFVQFFMNKPLFYGTLIAFAAAAAGGWRLWIVLKKRKDKEEQQ